MIRASYDVISKILNDGELGRRFGERGKKLVMEEFGWEKVVRKVETLYETTWTK